RVHRLQDDQDAVAIVGVEEVLGLGEAFQVLLHALESAGFDLHLAKGLHLLGLGPAGVVVLEPDLCAGLNAGQINDVFLNHDEGSLTTRTGQGASRTISSALLPQISRLSPVRPCVPMTIRTPAGSRSIMAKSNFLASPALPITTEYLIARPELS